MKHFTLNSLSNCTGPLLGSTFKDAWTYSRPRLV